MITGAKMNQVEIVAFGGALGERKKDKSGCGGGGVKENGLRKRK